MPAPALPDLPISSLVFRSARDGAVAFRVGGTAITSDGGATYRPGDWPAAPEEPAGDAPTLRWIRLIHADPLSVAASRGVALGDGTALAFALRNEDPLPWGVHQLHGPGMIGRIDLRTGAVRAILETEARCTLATTGVAGETHTPEVLAACPGPDVAGRLRVSRVVIGPSSIALGETLYEGEGEALVTSPGGGAMIELANGTLARQKDGRWARITTPDGALPSPLADGRLAYACVRAKGCPDGVSLRAVDAAGRTEHLADVRWSRPPRDKGSLLEPPPADPDALGVGRVVEGTDRALRLLVLAEGRVHLFVETPGQPAQPPRSVEGAARLFGGVEVLEGRGAVWAARVVGTGAVVVSDGDLRWTGDDGRTWSREVLPWGARDGERMGCFEDHRRALGDLGGVLDHLARLGWGPADAPPAMSQKAPKIDLAPPRPTIQAIACRSLPATAAPSSSPKATLDPPASSLGTKPGDATHASSGSPKGTLDPQKGVLDPQQAGAVQIHTPPYPLVARGSMQLERAEPAPRPSRWALRWVDPVEAGGTVHSPKAALALGGDAKLVWASAREDRALFAIRASGRVVLARATESGPIATIEPPAELLPHIELGKDEVPSLLYWSDVVFGKGPGEPIVWHTGRDEKDVWVVWSLGQPPKSFLQDQSAFDLAAPRDGVLPVLLGSHRSIWGGEAGEQGWAATRLFSLSPTSPPASPRASPSQAVPASPSTSSTSKQPASPAPAGASGASPWTRVRGMDGSAAFLQACAAGVTGDRFRVGSWRDLTVVALDGKGVASGNAVYEVVATASGGCVAAVTVEIEANPAMSLLHADFEHGTAEAGSLTARTTRLSCQLQPIGPPPDPHFP